MFCHGWRDMDETWCAWKLTWNLLLLLCYTLRYMSRNWFCLYLPVSFWLESLMWLLLLLNATWLNINGLTLNVLSITGYIKLVWYSLGCLAHYSLLFTIQCWTCRVCWWKLCKWKYLVLSMYWNIKYWVMYFVRKCER